MVVKVLDACDINSQFWVFAAGLTNVRVELTVRDTDTGLIATYVNPQQTPFQPVQDTNAFATCDGAGDLPPDPGPPGDATLAGIDSDNDGIRDDVQRYIALTYPDDPMTRGALTQLTRHSQDAILDADSPVAAVNHATNIVRSIECLNSVRGEDATRVDLELMRQLLDTEARGRAYLQYDSQLSGQFFPLRPVDEWSASCGFSVSPSGQITFNQSDTSRIRASCVSTDTKVFFVNGIWNDKRDAARSLASLSSRLRSSLPSQEYSGLTFEVAYNPSHLYILDLWESVIQLVPSLGDLLAMLAGIRPMPPQVQATLITLSLAADAQAVMTNNVLQGHLARYREDMSEGKQVLVVAHSQGNFFANDAYQALTQEERESFGLISVATPETPLSHPARYTTLTEDKVMTALRPLGAPAANRTNGVATFLGHNFILDYLRSGSPSLAKVLDDSTAVKDTLEIPAGPASDGVITVTLTWGAQPDVDLHVFEPNGEHVFYANTVGQSGFLDVDDVTGFGPEHYFVSCDTLETGRYHIGVNYYLGSAPETANIRIDAGLLVRNFQVHLPDDRGPAGDGDPIPVAEIIVTGNADSGFEFAVE